MAHSYVEVFLHVIFSTKNHQPFLTPDLEEKLYPYMVGIARKNKIYIHAMNGALDHVHILLKLNANTAIGKFIGDLKCLSTGNIKRSGWEVFSWQEGYGAFSCSKNHADKVVEYIRNQKNHHQTVSFRQEIEKISKIWGIPWIEDLDPSFSTTGEIKT